MTEAFAVWATAHPYLTFFGFCMACTCFGGAVAGLGQIGMTKHYHRGQDRGGGSGKASETGKIGSDHDRASTDPHPLVEDKKD